MMTSKTVITQFFKDLQDSICSELATEDGTGSFQEENWVREGGGGGSSRVMEGGRVFEKAGVNFSAVHGRLPEKIKQSFDVPKDEFYATGISLVLHPGNPYVPIVHMNLRYFELEDRLWFGGGIDLTPHYVNEAEARAFHLGLQAICDRHDPGYYTRFKSWADTYFFIAHRNETRGVGGVFFDRLQAKPGESISSIFEFVKELGLAFTGLYLPLVRTNSVRNFGAAEREWQLLRRSRYVEFNLVYDSGTRFGLETNGRTESILMSLPPLASWKYNIVPLAGSPEALTVSFLRKDIDWRRG